MTLSLPAPILERIDRLLALDATRRGALTADLDCFRTLVMVRPGALRRELLELAEERRSALAGSAAMVFEVLNTDPDYLGPLGFTREETSNTRFLSWILGDARLGGLGDAPAREVWALFHRRWEADTTLQLHNDSLERVTLPCGDARAVAEVDLGGPGRIDVQWEVGGGSVLIEAKVDATPSTSDTQRYQRWRQRYGLPHVGHTQLERYRAWLERPERGGRPRALVYLRRRPSGGDYDLALARGDESGAESADDQVTESDYEVGVRESRAISVSWREVLQALIPASVGGTDAHRALRAWLKTLAILEDVAPPGAWERWTVVERLSVLREANEMCATGRQP
jgi:hypothetical protein